LRASKLDGITVPGLPERVITTMFADDTTVFMRGTDSYNDLLAILNRWCAGARAKFNEPKTVVIPIGPRTYRDRLRLARAIPAGENAMPAGTRILEEGEATRILGAWLGPGQDDEAPWIPVVDTIERNLDRWERRRPTLRGRQLIANLEVGSRTQYLTRVQGMPTTVETRLKKITADFLWQGRPAAVAEEVTTARAGEGGLGLLCLSARNEAIELMWLKEYLDLSSARPRWAFVADALVARAILAPQRVVDKRARVNVFLQSWDINTASTAGLPRDLAKMIKVARKFGVRLDAMSPSRNLTEALPVWYH
ncbi:hypothetical protein C2E23DRAFT_689111, partial [Lenzites betulinus]